jgi:hypothetical protein
MNLEEFAASQKHKTPFRVLEEFKEQETGLYEISPPGDLIGQSQHPGLI